jgi:hypothetical protein
LFHFHFNQFGAHFFFFFGSFWCQFGVFCQLFAYFSMLQEKVKTIKIYKDGWRDVTKKYLMSFRIFIICSQKLSFSEHIVLFLKFKVSLACLSNFICSSLICVYIFLSFWNFSSLVFARSSSANAFSIKIFELKIYWRKSVEIFLTFQAWCWL